jgi:ADP-heptose:LPS heptosyltransferase
MGNKYYIEEGGGLGDILSCYFGGKRRQTAFGYVDHLLKIEPKAKIKLILRGSNDQAYEFFRYNPLFYKIEEHEWQHPGIRNQTPPEEIAGHACLRTTGKHLRWPKSPLSEVYLTKQDERAVAQIVEKGPFVVLHPFAGKETRIPLTPRQYAPMINTIRRRFGYNVVVVGATHLGAENKGPYHFEMVTREEVFDYNAPNIINIVSKSNVRQIIALMKKAKSLIATDSCFLCATAGGDIPVAIIRQDEERFVRAVNAVWAKTDLISYVNPYRGPKYIVAEVMKHLETKAKQ